MGDKNTKFFHATTLIRKQCNKIKGLRRENGVWIWEEKELESLAISYFKKLFTSEIPTDRVFSTPCNFPQWGLMDSTLLSAPFTDEEVRTAIMGTSPYKVLGTDRFQAVFFQKLWSVVERDVVTTTLNCLNC